MSSKFPMQHCGFNTELVPVLPESESQLEVEMFALMNAIDCIGCKSCWTQADFEYYRKHVDMVIEKTFHHYETFIFYLGWLGDAWSIDGTITRVPDVVVSMLSYEDNY